MSSRDLLASLTTEQKRALLRQTLARQSGETRSAGAGASTPDRVGPTQPSFDQFLTGSDQQLSEISRFNEWVEHTTRAGRYTFELPRQDAQRPTNTVVRESGEELPVINMASYNYLGFGYDPRVLSAAKGALDRFGLGVSASPVAGGTIELHRELEQELVDFLGIPGTKASLFSSGYAVNTGSISALIKPPGHVVLDRSAHMSMIEGAQLSRGSTRMFDHNDLDDLDRVLREIRRTSQDRILVCTEGVYSVEGDIGDLRGVVSTAKRHGALVLVDEAHSILATGPDGRGVAAAQGVLAEIDLFVVTFSKGFGGVGGAVIARRDIAQYINWFARSRMFSCGLDPAVTGGLIESLRLARSGEGDERRARLHANARLLRDLLSDRVRVLAGDSWIVPVLYGPDDLTLPLTDHLQRSGLDVSIIQYPAVPRHLSRLRLFVTSEHSDDQLRGAAEIVLRAAEKFGFEVA